MLTLLFGELADPPLGAVHDALSRIRSPVIVLDLRALVGAELDLTSSDRLSGTLVLAERRVELDEVTGLYLRSSTLPSAEVMSGAVDPAVLRHLLALHDALLTWADTTSARVLNRPYAMASNNSKPYQLALIRAQGFDVPETLVTTDPDAARDFCEHHGEVIYKSVSGVRSRVSRVGPAQLARIDQVRSCPTQFQRRIIGRDVRVHVVGDEVFARDVLSDADDYRYPAPGEEPTRLRPVHLPEVLADRCRVLAAALDLPLAGIDLRRADDGVWYVFEVNPSPAFSCFELDEAAPIAAAVARWLSTRKFA